MKSISLVLTSPRGDELGRLMLGEVAVAGPGEGTAATRPRLAEEMENLEDRIRAAITREGMEVALDPLDFRIAVSRALLEEQAPDEVRIPLPVRDAPVPSAAGTDGRGAAAAEAPLPALDDLFPLTFTEESDDETSI